MEREVWSWAVALVTRVGVPPRNRRYTFGWDEIVFTFLWAVLHDRPICWACQRANWPEELCPARRPTPATMSRRLRDPLVLELLRALLRHLQRGTARGLLSIIDGKPLPVGNYSRDPDARFGHAAGGYAKGYKLHLICGKNSRTENWALRPMNVDERVVARELVPAAGLAGYLLGDSFYDDNRLHQECRAHGVQLVAPRRCQPGQGLGHRPQCPARLRSIALLEGSQTGFGPQLLAARSEIERRFGQLCSAWYGLPPLPAWVRRQHRVELWVAAKLVLHTLIRRRRKRTA